MQLRRTSLRLQKIEFMPEQPHFLRYLLALKFALSCAPCTFALVFYLISGVIRVSPATHRAEISVMAIATINVIIAAALSVIISFVVFRFVSRKSRKI